MKEQDTKQSNQVVLQDGYIEVIISGHQDKEKIRQLNLDAEQVFDKFKSQNKSLLILVTLKNLDSTPNIGAFKESLKIFEVEQLERLAMTGDLPELMMSIIDNVINSLSRGLEIKYFKDRTEAIAWLKSNK